MLRGPARGTTPLVVRGTGPSLLGRNWLQKIRLDWQEIHQLQQMPALQETLKRYAEVFENELGEIKRMEARIDVDPQARPCFCKARPVPFALKHKVEAELDRLLKEGIVESVKSAEWAAPIVPVVKSDGSVRICGDYRMTVNQASRLDSYPLPRVDELFATLAGGNTFSKLDLQHAYLELPLETNSKQYTTINTHRGLFQYNRLPFGVSSAPGIFQRAIDDLVKGIPHVAAYMDDILLTGETQEQHLQNLTAVLERLKAAGVRLKKPKCSWQRRFLATR